TTSDYGKIEANERFWQDHASLHYFGVMNEALSVTADPSPTHPLSQIYFLESYRLHSGDWYDFDKAVDTLRRIPNLKRVTVPTFLNSWPAQQKEKMLALYQQETLRKVEFAHHYGVTMSYERRRTYPDIPLPELIIGGTLEGMVMTCFIYHKLTGGNALTESLMPHLITLEIAAVALTLI
ncbi:2476_t:CDS:1, partial [Acaulospora colombiana]